MRWFRNILMGIILICGLVLGIWISTDNVEPVSIVLLGFPMPPVASGVLISGVLLLGAIIGYLVSVISGLKVRSDNRSLKRRLQQREKEIERLRAP